MEILNSINYEMIWEYTKLIFEIGIWIFMILVTMFIPIIFWVGLEDWGSKIVSSFFTMWPIIILLYSGYERLYPKEEEPRTTYIQSLNYKEPRKEVCGDIVNGTIIIIPCRSHASR